MSTIPASGLVSVLPSVLAAGGTGLNGTGLILTHNTRVPMGTLNAPTVQSFNSQAAVSAYFGASDPLVAEAGIYFLGFIGSTVTPSTLLIAQFPQNQVSAYIRGGNISGLTLAQLQAINASLTATVDGYARTATVNLSAATSFSNAASIIQTALNGAITPIGTAPTSTIAAVSSSFTGSIAGWVMSVTTTPSSPLVVGAAVTGSGVTANTTISAQLSGTAGGIGTYAVSISQVVASESLTVTYGTLTAVSPTGVMAVGQTITGTGVSAGTIITALGTGTGGAGTYFVNLTQTVASTTLTFSPTALVVTFDSVSGAFIITSGIVGSASTVAFCTGAAATSLLLTSATGAVLSQGANPLTVAAFMTSLVTANNAWVNFMTHPDPDAGSGNTVKQAFAAWKQTQNNRYGYFCWDPDTSPAASSSAPASLGALLKTANDSGTLLIWEGGGPATVQDTGLCAFALGLAASINYNQVNGRANFAFRQGTGEIANVTDPVTAGNLLANGYCFYGAYGAANNPFVWFQNGQITGPYAWADSYQTQIWMNSFFQNQLLTMQQNNLSVPFTTQGISLIQQTCQTVIQAAAAFGAFAPNTLTPAQIAAVNSQAGVNIATALQALGYYLQVTLPSQTVQTARGPWPITFWYIDRNSVQTINLSSVLVP